MPVSVGVLGVAVRLLTFLQPAAQCQVHEVPFHALFNSKPQWLLDLNPAGLVPFIAWRQDNTSSGSSSSRGGSSEYGVTTAAAAAAADGTSIVSIRESLICAEYLEDKFAEPPVRPDMSEPPTGRCCAVLCAVTYAPLKASSAGRSVGV